MQPVLKNWSQYLVQTNNTGTGKQFGDPGVRETLMPMRRILTHDTSMSDARNYIAFLDRQKSVDTSRKIGTNGYCMDGPLIMRTADAVPEQVGTAVSFHGGGLVTCGENSPHLLIPSSPGHVLHAVAEIGATRNPDVKHVLAAAYR